MTWRTGNVANTLPSPNLINSVIAPDMVNTGWVQVSTNVAANNYLWNVYKSPGANNSLGNDWYLAFGWDTASNCNLFITIMENWDNTLNVARNYVPNTSSIFPQPNGVCNVNPSVLPNISTSNIGYIGTGMSLTQGGNTALSTSANNIYFQSITIDRVIVATSNGANATGSNTFNVGITAYAGMYDSYWRTNTEYGVADTMPLVLMMFTYQNSLGHLPQAANSPSMPPIFTREIGIFSLGLTPDTTNFQGYAQKQLNYWDGVLNQKDVYTGQYQISRVVLNGRFSTASNYPSVRGLLKDVWYSSVYGVKFDPVQWVQNGVTVSGNLAGVNYAAAGTMGTTGIAGYAVIAQV